jgi:hypothetical protein
MVDARRSARTAAAQRAHAASGLLSEPPRPRDSVQGSLLPNAASSSTVVSVWQHRAACLLRCAAERRGNRLVRLAVPRVQRGPPAARTTGAAAGIACAAGASSRQQAGDCAACSARPRTASSCGPSASVPRASILSRPAASARAPAAGTEAAARSLLTVAGKGRAFEAGPTCLLPVEGRLGRWARTLGLFTELTEHALVSLVTEGIINMG